MLHMLTRLALSFVLGFTALTTAVCALGNSQPTNATLAGFTEGCEDKPQPCWYGIVPGVTTVEQADVIVKGKNYVLMSDGEAYQHHSYVASNTIAACQFDLYFHDDSIQEMAISPCGNVNLGDLASLFGAPATVTGVGIILFDDRQVWAELPYTHDPQCWAVGVYGEVSLIRLVPQKTFDDVYSYFQREPVAPWTSSMSFLWYTDMYGLKCRANI